jgi:hypothetical protein
MKVSNVTGFFDCRVYKKDTKRGQRPMSKQGDRINLSLSFDADTIPEEFKEFAKASSKNEKLYLSCKVFPNNIKAFSASAQVIDFPTNEQLDGNSFLINIETSIKHGTGTELNGVYVNKIQFIKRANESFEAIEDGDDSMFGVSMTPMQVSNEQQKAESEPKTSPKAEPKADTKLPF